MEGYLVAPRISIIVPACGDQEALDDTLVSVLENRPADCEVLVACGRSYRDPYDLDDEVHFVRTRDEWGWNQLVTAALPASRASVVHVLYPGVQPCKSWVEPAIAVMQCDRSVGAISPVIDHATTAAQRSLVTGVRFSGLGNRQLAYERTQDTCRLTKTTVTGPSFMAGFFRREALQSVGLWDTSLGQWNSDVDLGLRLAAKGWRCRVEPGCRCTANVLAIQATLGKERLLYGMRAEQLCARHRRQLSTLGVACHFPAALALALGELPSPNAVAQIMGRMLGWLVPAPTARQDVPRVADQDAGPIDDTSAQPLPRSRPHVRRAA